MRNFLIVLFFVIATTASATTVTVDRLESNQFLIESCEYVEKTSKNQIAWGNVGQCMGACASEQGMCISQCRGDGVCISNCAAAHGRCVSRCH